MVTGAWTLWTAGADAPPAERKASQAVRERSEMAAWRLSKATEDDGAAEDREADRPEKPFSRAACSENEVQEEDRERPDGPLELLELIVENWPEEGRPFVFECSLSGETDERSSL